MNEHVPIFELVTKRSDIAALVSLAHEIWPEHYTPIIGEQQVEYMLQNLHSEKVLLEQIQHENFFYYLIKLGDESIGYLAFQIREQDIFLSKLYLKRQCRGAGIGRKALEFIKQQTIDQGQNIISLRVNKDNHKTIAAYYQLGFKKVGEDCADIGASYVMDDLIMQLVID